MLLGAHRSYDVVHSLNIRDLATAQTYSIVTQTARQTARRFLLIYEVVAMERESKQVKPYLYGVLIFTTLGISFANTALSRIGLEGNRIAVFSIAFLLAAILLSRNLVMVAIVILGVLVLNLPDTTLLQYQLDRDVLLAMVSAAILVPSVYELIAK